MDAGLLEQSIDAWTQFVACLQERISPAEFSNWISPIKCVAASNDEATLEVPNIFVQEYLLDNYSKDLLLFFPKRKNGSLAIVFVIAEQIKIVSADPPPEEKGAASSHELRLNPNYTFHNFIEGPANQFVKSATIGVAAKPGRSYNPLFIHGGVGLGKTHLLHAIGHHIQEHHRKLRIQYITTEAFINDLVDHLRNKSIDRMKRFYRSLDILLVDDIQFLQNRLNFEEEFCNTFEILIHQNKQIVITSDKPPSQLKLSERLIARMEWGLVAHIGAPDFETRVAILQHKAEQKGIRIPKTVAFFLAEHIFHNVRQLEGALNRLAAYCRLMGLEATEEVAEKTLADTLQATPQKRLSVDQILTSVASLYDVRVSDLRGSSRIKNVAFPRQVAMYLAKELLSDSLMKLAASFGGKTHSTLLHAWKKISLQMKDDDNLRLQIQTAKKKLEV